MRRSMSFAVLVALLVPAGSADAAFALYGTNIWTNTLVTFDLTSGAQTTLGPLGFRGVGTLAYDPVTDQLLGVGEGQLLSIDRNTGQASSIAAFSPGVTVTGMAVDTSTGDLLGVTLTSNLLVRIDRETAEATTLATMDQPLSGLAYDPNSDTLIGADNVSNSLFTVDTTSGDVSSIGEVTSGGETLEGAVAMSFDPDSGSLFATDVGGIIAFTQLLTIDPASAVASPIGGKTQGSILAVEFAPVPGVPEPSCFLVFVALGACVATAHSRSRAGV